MNAVFIIPTGIGCEIGGHAGDATPAAKLIASMCDKLIINPNAINAASYNEMSENMLYVEGSTIDRFLNGDLTLKEVNGNRILLVINEVTADIINSVSVARTLLGANIKILKLDTPLKMKGWVDENNIATGEHSGIDELIKQLYDYEDDYDALALLTPIDVESGIALKYFREGGTNPWGKIEAIVSRKISMGLDKPVAHAPRESEETKDTPELLNLVYDEVCDPRMSGEITSCCYIHCVFKGLFKSPRLITEKNVHKVLSVDDIDCLVTPYGCWDLPHICCRDKGIPIIAVEENKSAEYYDKKHDAEIIKVNNYIEAAGYVAAIKAGIDPLTVRRPLGGSEILN